MNEKEFRLKIVEKLDWIGYCLFVSFGGIVFIGFVIAFK